MPLRGEPASADLVPVAAQSGFSLTSDRRLDLLQHRINARSRFNECLRPCRVDYAQSGSSKNGQIRCDGMNFDTPTSPLRVSSNFIATILFGSLGHWKIPSLQKQRPNRMVSSGREGTTSKRVSSWHQLAALLMSALCHKRSCPIDDKKEAPPRNGASLRDNPPN